MLPYQDGQLVLMLGLGSTKYAKEVVDSGIVMQQVFAVGGINVCFDNRGVGSICSRTSTMIMWLKQRWMENETISGDNECCHFILDP